MPLSRKSRFFPTFAGALLLGGIIGFFWNILSENLLQAPQSTEEHPRRANQFKPSNLKNDNSLPAPTVSNMERLIGQYMELTDQELLEELDRRTRNLIPNADCPFSESLALQYLAYRVGTTSPEKALRWLDSISPQIKKIIFQDIIQGCLQSDLKKTTAYLLQHKNDHDNISFLCRDIAVDMVKRSPDQAIDWLLTLDAGARRYLLADTIRFIPGERLSEMSRYVKKISPQDLKNNKIREIIVQNWSKADWPAVKKWIDTLPPEQKSSTLSAAIGNLVSVNEEAAKAELHTMNDEEKIYTAKLASAELAYESPDKAMEWVSSCISNPNDVFDAVSTIGSRLTGNNMKLVSQYLSRQPDGPVKESMLGGLLDGMRHMDDKPANILQTSLSLCELAQTPEKQNKLLRKTLDSWADSYPEELLTWLEKNSPLSPALKTEYKTKCRPAETDE